MEILPSLNTSNSFSSPLCSHEKMNLPSRATTNLSSPSQATENPYNISIDTSSQTTTNSFSSTLCSYEKMNKSSAHSSPERTPQKIRFIAIEGNIGAGKSTLFENIQGYMNEYELNTDNHIVFLREPVDLWENVKNEEGKNMLELFYENPQKYAFEFQTMALTIQIKLLDETLKNNPQCTTIVSERSFSAGHNVFTKMLVDDGYISYIQYEIYKLLVKTRTETENVPHIGVPDKVLYLDIPANECKKRIGKRGRGGEGSISLEYLEKCEKYYKKWLFSKSTGEENPIQKSRLLKQEEILNIDLIVQQILRV
jgi:deoxyadenosine/deoxycytidine kinase